MGCLAVRSDTYREFAAECTFIITVQFGYLDVGEARKLLLGQVIPYWTKFLAVATPSVQSKKKTKKNMSCSIYSDCVF